MCIDIKEDKKIKLNSFIWDKEVTRPQAFALEDVLFVALHIDSSAFQMQPGILIGFMSWQSQWGSGLKDSTNSEIIFISVQRDTWDWIPVTFHFLQIISKITSECKAVELPLL